MRQSNLLTCLDHASFSVSTKLESELREAFLRGTPFAYLLQQVEFFGHQFYVNEKVLIPRPETEYLVELAVVFAKSRAAPLERVLDVGSGSGVILLSLLLEPQFKTGLGIDISDSALAVARANQRRLRVSTAEFRLGDRLDPVAGERFDFIISNPPYIRAHSQHLLVHPSVDLHEPSVALYLEDDAYDLWFEDFFHGVKSALLPGGIFFMEGHELEVELQAEALTRLGFREVTVLRDLAQRPRYLRATLE